MIGTAKKGATGLPLEVLVGIVIAVVLILAALIFFGILPGLGQVQSDRGYFETCCVAYKIAGGCDTPNENFECTANGEKVGIKQLAGNANMPLDYCCR